MIFPVPDNIFIGRLEESSIMIVFPDAFFIIAGALFPISSPNALIFSLFVVICANSSSEIPPKSPSDGAGGMRVFFSISPVLLFLTFKNAAFPISLVAMSYLLTQS